jgi:hypothetical protein
LATAWDVGLDLRDKAQGNNWGQVILHTFTGSSGRPDVNGGLVALLILGGVILYLMVLILSVQAARQKTVQLAEVWDVFKTKWWKILLVEVLTFAAIGLGFLLLIIPGLYLLSRLALAPIIAVDQDVGITEALNKSWDMTKDHAWIVFITVFFGFLLGLPAIIPIVGKIAATALTIVYSVALPLRYFELKKLAK